MTRSPPTSSTDCRRPAVGGPSCSARAPWERGAKRGWLWPSFASLGGVLLVAAGLALWLADDSAVVSLHGLAALRPATVRPGGGEVERGGSPDTTGARPPGRTSSPSPTPTSEDAPATP